MLSSKPSTPQKIFPTVQFSLRNASMGNDTDYTSASILTSEEEEDSSSLFQRIRANKRKNKRQERSNHSSLFHSGSSVSLTELTPQSVLADLKPGRGGEKSMISKRRKNGKSVPSIKEFMYRVLDPESYQFESAVKACKEYNEYTKQRLVLLGDESSIDAYLRRVDDRVNKKNIDLFGSLGESLPKATKKQLYRILFTQTDEENEDSDSEDVSEWLGMIDGESKDFTSMRIEEEEKEFDIEEQFSDQTLEKIGQGLGLKPGQVAMMIPSLRKKSRRENIPRQDGKDGPPDETRYSHEWQQNFFERKINTYSLVVMKFVTMVAGATKLPVKDFIDNDDLDARRRDIEAEERETKERMRILSNRLRTTLGQYQEAVFALVEQEELKEITEKDLELSAEAIPLDESFVKLLPRNTSVSFVKTLMEMYQSAASVSKWYKFIFEKIQLSQAEKAFATDSTTYAISLQTVAASFDHYITELLWEELSRDGLSFMTSGESAFLQTEEGGDVIPLTPGHTDTRFDDYDDPNMTDSAIREIKDTFPLGVRDMFTILSSMRKGLAYVEATLGGTGFTTLIYSNMSRLAKEVLEIKEKRDKEGFRTSQYITLDKDMKDTFEKYSDSFSLALVVSMAPYVAQVVPNIDLAILTITESRVGPALASHFKKDSAAFMKSLVPVPLGHPAAGISPTVGSVNVNLKSGYNSLFLMYDRYTAVISSPLVILVDIIAKPSEIMPFITDEPIPVPSTTFEKRLDDIIEDAFEFVRKVFFGKRIEILQNRKSGAEDKEDVGERITQKYNLLRDIMRDIATMTVTRITQDPAILEQLNLVRRRIEKLESFIKQILDTIGKIKPKYYHKADYALSPENSGYIQVTPELVYANAMAFAIVRENFPDIARAGFTRLQGDDEILPHFAALVAAIMLMVNSNFSKRWTKSSLPKQALMSLATTFESLSDYTYSGDRWLYQPGRRGVRPRPGDQIGRNMFYPGVERIKDSFW